MKDIKGYEGIYKIDKDGNVWSIANKKFLKKHIDRHGYTRITLHKNKKLTNLLLHRLIAQTFLENPNNFVSVNHIDGDHTNNSLYNLEWCSIRDNLHHAWKTGLMKRKKTSKYPGVIQRKNSKVWFLRVKRNHKDYFSKPFSTEIEAHNNYELFYNSIVV